MTAFGMLENKKRLFGVFCAFVLFSLTLMPFIGSAETTGQVTRNVVSTDVCPDEVVTVTITPSGIPGFYAVQEDIGDLSLVDHTADNLAEGVFIMLQANPFTYQVQVPSTATEGQQFPISGLFWDDPEDKRQTGTTTLTVHCVQPPVADFVGTPTTGTAPLLVDFTNQSTGAPTRSE